MGGVNDKPQSPYYRQQPSNPTPSSFSAAIKTNNSNYSQSSATVPTPLLNQDPTAQARLQDALKKRDTILFSKILEAYHIRAIDTIGPTAQNKTLLHKLAENNFSEGMALVLDRLSTQRHDVITKILNAKDCDGNSPLLLCCLSNSVETLEILSRDPHVDLEAKNNAHKTALEIAMEMESPCINVLTSLSSAKDKDQVSSTKNTLKSSGATADSSNPQSQHTLSLEDTGPGSRDLDGYSNSQSSISTPGSTINLGATIRPSAFSEHRRTSLTVQTKPQSSSFPQARLPQVLVDLSMSGESFKDSEFPHEWGYLVGAEEGEEEVIKRYPGLQWRRPEEFEKGAKLFDGYSVGDISNSVLAGSELYGALGAMSEWPQRLTRVFSNTNVNEGGSQGVYALKFIVAGTSIEVLLDDYFPCGADGKPLYARPNNKELWYMLLEKGFAKLIGGYGELERFGLAETLEILTGMPVLQWSLAKPDEDRLWRKMLDYDKRNYIIIGSMNKKVDFNTSKNSYFSIVNIYETGDQRVMKLKDPFGDLNWKGDLSRGPDSWSAELKEKVGYTQGDKGAFYMTFKEFLKEFSLITICHYHDGWQRNKLNVSSDPNHAVFFEINVDKEVDSYISIHQKQPEFVDEGPEYDVSPVESVLARDVDSYMDPVAYGEQTAFAGKPVTYIQDGLETKLKPGRYVLYVKIRWVDGRTHDFFLNILSSSAVRLIQLDKTSCENFLEKSYMSAGMISQDKFEMGRGCEFNSGWAGSRLWMCAFNKGNKTWHLEITFDRMANLKLAKKFRSGNNVLKIVLPPGQKSVAFAKRLGPEAVAVKWRFEQYWD